MYIVPRAQEPGTPAGSTGTGTPGTQERSAGGTGAPTWPAARTLPGERARHCARRLVWHRVAREEVCVCDCIGIMSANDKCHGARKAAEHVLPSSVYEHRQYCCRSLTCGVTESADALCSCSCCAQPPRAGLFHRVLQPGESLASPARRGRRRQRCPGRRTHTRPNRQSRSSRRRTSARSSQLAEHLARWKRPCHRAARIFHEGGSPLSRRRDRRRSLRTRTTECRC